MGRVRIGVSGWSYAHWRKGAFYPDRMPQRRELEYLSRRLSTVEINASFYSLLEPRIYAGYRQQVPDGFRFAVKGGGFITHSKKLKDVEVALANFFASGVLRLEDALGPFLWQLPRMAVDASRVAAFLALLPRGTGAASRLARRHDERVRGRSSVTVYRERSIRHALEVRHPSLLSDDVVRACRRHNVALVFSHNGGDWPYVEEVTAGWCYLRLHGAPHTYTSDYDAAALARWAPRVGAWHQGGQPDDAVHLTGLQPPARKSRDVYLYFDNDQGAHAPLDALALSNLVLQGEDEFERG